MGVQSENNHERSLLVSVVSSGRRLVAGWVVQVLSGWSLRVVAAGGLLEFEVGLRVGLCRFAVEVRSEFNHERMMIE